MSEEFVGREAQLTAFDGKRRRGRRALDRVKIRVFTGEESRVQQQYRDEVDVKNIVARFGLYTAPVVHSGVYGDFTGVDDYASAKAAIERAEANFLALPAETRDRFQNDPGRFLSFVERATEDEMTAVFGTAKPEVVVPTPPQEEPPV